MLRSSGSGPGGALRKVAARGTAMVLMPWAVGKILQSDAVIRPSRRLYEYCRAHRSAALARRMDPLTSLGDYAVIGSMSLLVGGILAYERRDWRPVPLLASGVVAEIYLQKALKRLVRGSKPPQEFSIGTPGDFPSGGAARTVITFGLLAHLLTQRWASPAERRIIWSIVAMLVAGQGYSRLYLGRHWPEDVAGGWLFGWLVLRTLTGADDALRRPAAGPL